MMDCPKCGASQPDGGEECSSCGVVYERWRTAQEREMLAARVAPQVQYTPAERGLPPWMVGAALLAVVVLGLVWTVRVRQARANRDPVRELTEEANRRNAEGNRIRAKLSEAEAEAKRQRYLTQKRMNEANVAVQKIAWPDGLTREIAAGLLEQCHGFNQPQSELLPTTFRDLSYRSMLERYPVMFTALQERFVELDPPIEHGREASSYQELQNARTIWLRPTAEGLASLGFVESGEEFQVDLGRRRLDSFKRLYGTFEATKVEFYWSYERPGGARLRSEGKPEGWIELVQDGRDWRVRTGQVTERNRPVTVCG